MVGIKNNRRARHTQEIIQETVLAFLETKPIDAITVTEVCEKANINRTTFYRYYDDVNDCEDQIESEFIDALDFKKDAQPFESLETLLESFYKKPKLSNLVFVEGKTRVLEKMYQTFGGNRPDTALEINPYEEIYIMSGIQNVLKRWVKLGMKETPKELTKTIIQLLFADDIRPFKGQLDLSAYE